MSNLKRVGSIDLLRGTVMIIMALDHVRDYFHHDAFWYSPTDLTHASIPLFFTRWITHYSAPVFVFLAGVSAYLYGAKRSRGELAFFLLTRGIWLVLAELFIVGLFRNFNPTYPYLNLQVIWAIGICMMILSAIIYLPKQWILIIGALIVASHNLLDTIHVKGNTTPAFIWSLVHDPGRFQCGNTTIYVRYPFLPWVGIICLGYYFGHFYNAAYDAQKRRKLFLLLGLGAIALFIILRAGNFYGDAAKWSEQKNIAYNILSFINTTKYPPSLLYTLMTLGPALIFLSLTEKSLPRWTAAVSVFGRVPMFYYLAHILLIHVLAIMAAAFAGYHYQDLAVLQMPVNDTPELKEYGFSLLTTYLFWMLLVVLLYPVCKAYDRYKKNASAAKALVELYMTNRLFKKRNAGDRIFFKAFFIDVDADARFFRDRYKTILHPFAIVFHNFFETRVGMEIRLPFEN